MYITHIDNFLYYLYETSDWLNHNRNVNIHTNIQLKISTNGVNKILNRI